MNLSVSKKVTILSLLIIAAAIVALLLLNQNNSAASSNDIIDVHTSGDVAESFSSVEELYENASLVVQVEASITKAIEFSGITFTLTDGKIEKIYKGVFEPNDVISILETGGVSEVNSNNKVQRVNYIFEENEVFKTGDKAIVFLKKYSGPIAENSYVVLGVYQGKFLINGEKIIAPEHGIEDISEIEDLKLN